MICNAPKYILATERTFAERIQSQGSIVLHSPAKSIIAIIFKNDVEMINHTAIINHHQLISHILISIIFSHSLDASLNEHRVLVILHVMTQVGTDGRRCIWRSRQACR